MLQREEVPSSTILVGGGFTNCQFDGNQALASGGGAVYNSGGGPEFIGCGFINNRTGWAGGAIYNGGRAQENRECVFIGNQAQAGGAMSITEANRFIFNSIFLGNKAETLGGAVYLGKSDSTFSHCTFSGNRADEGGAIFINFSSNPSLVNSIVWNNESLSSIIPVRASIGKADNDDSEITITHSLVEHSGGSSNWGTRTGIDEGNNLDSDSNFLTPVDPSTAPTTLGNLALLPGSPAIDAGDNEAVSSFFVGETATVVDYPTDVAGYPRAIKGFLETARVDMGAYELNPARAPLTTLSITTNTGMVTRSDEARYWISFSKHVSNFDSVTTDLVIETTVTINFDPPFISGGGDIYELTFQKITGEVTLSVSVATDSDIQDDLGEALFYSPTSPSILFVAPDSTIRFVRAANQSPIAPYTDWDSAATDLQLAIDSCFPGDMVWVAKGVYQPGTSMDRIATFRLKNGVTIFGRFSGTETKLIQRSEDPETNETILSSDLLNNDNGEETNYFDNVYHVVTGTGNNATAVLDGFTITGGYANSQFPHDSGGGFYSDGPRTPTLTNCRFIENFAQAKGGAVYIQGTTASISNSQFLSNTSAYGGAIYLDELGNMEISNSIFSGNIGGLGGAVYNNQCSRLSYINCAFTGNDSYTSGGVCNNQGSEIQYINCTFTANKRGRDGGAIHNVSSSPHFLNCIIWWNGNEPYANQAESSVLNENSSPLFSYSLVANSGGSFDWNPETGVDGGNNIDIDPQFSKAISPNSTPTTDGDFRLTVASTVLDSGDKTVNPSYVDLADGKRVRNGQIDLGPYEGGLLFDETFQYQDWIEAYYSRNLGEDVLGPTQDRDEDQLTNLEEYAFGLNPTKHDRSIVLERTYMETRGTPVALILEEGRAMVFSQRSGFKSLGLSYTFECSEDLNTWTACQGDTISMDRDGEMELTGFILDEASYNSGKRQFLRATVHLDQ